MWIIHESRAACGQLENHPTPLRGRPRTDPPGATPTSRPVRSGPAEGSLGRIPRGPPSGTSHRSRRKRRPRYRDPGLGHWARRRAPPAPLVLLRRRALLAPTRVVDNLHGISAPTRVISPSRCRQPPHNVDNPLVVPTTRARAGRAIALRAHWANPPVWCRSPRVTHTRTPIYETPDAHNGLIPPLCATPCFLILSLVCDTKKNARPGR